MQSTGLLSLLIAGAACATVAVPPAGSRLAIDERYPYRSQAFTRMVTESHQRCGTKAPHDFYGWMEQAYRRSSVRLTGDPGQGLTAALLTKKGELASLTDPGQRAEAEAALGARLHRLVKTTIPRFSLDRGFEFCSVVRYGERQCFLQAVLIAALLQRIGVDAGVVMVSRNTHGRETNNGHAVALLRLSNGQDMIVDASEAAPHARHQGLFVRCGRYQYVEPVFEERTGRILRYRLTSGRGARETRQVRCLDLPFIHSQFWYYRG
jgi:hypothetical protein